MSEVTIRIAAIADAESIAGLTRELGYEVSIESSAERLARLDSGHDAVFVASTDGVVVAWIHVAIVHSLENDPYAEIRGLVVGSESRSGGIGARLVETAEEWAATHGLDRMRVRSNVVRTDARRFYERHGYAVTKTSNVFDKKLC